MKNTWASFFYPIATSISVIYVNKISTSLSPLLSLLICVSLATAFFHVVSYRKIRLIYQSALHNWQQSLRINLLLLVIWVSMFYALSLINPYSFILIYFITPAIITYAIKCKHEPRYSTFIACVGLSLVACAYLLFFYGQSLFHTKQLIGILLSTIGGVSAFYYRTCSARYSQMIPGGAVAILAVRSFGIIIGCIVGLALLSLLHQHPLTGLAVSNGQLYLNLLIILILSFVLPLYLNQKGIEKCGPLIHSCIAAICPLSTLILACFFGFYHNHIPQVTLLFVSSVVIVILLLLPKINEMKYSLRSV